MATTFKTLIQANDVTSAKTLLHEAIPITGSIISGTYNEGGKATENNIKNYSHEMFQSVYDYPYLSSSANHLFDVAVGISPNSALSASAPAKYSQQDKKVNMYNQMAQVLMGFDHTASIIEFDVDGDVSAGGTKFREVFFLNLSRLLTKDEVKKESFKLQIATGSKKETIRKIDFDGLKTLSDYNAASEYKVNSPAGEYGLLYTASTDKANSRPAQGLIFYQAGVAVVTASSGLFAGDFGNTAFSSAYSIGYDTKNVNTMLSGAGITASCDGFRNRWYNLTLNNTVELNSTIYFCRMNHNEFNYSSNPTYTSASQILVKEVPSDAPTSYVTTIGLYSPDNELMATAKLSEPLKKDPSNELTLRVRLDY